MVASGGKEMEIAIKIAGKVENSFKGALGKVTKGLGSIAKSVSAATTAAAAAVGAMGIAAINTGREFESAMSQVAATMLLDKTTEEGQKAFETLENAARECGASTAFSATEAAEALNYLALAGYDADKAATALPTVLKLAGAGAMDLAAASDMVTDSMSALGIEATQDNLTDFADKLAQTASKSNTSVAQLGEAILTVGGTAKGLAGGTTELNTALGILADSGIKASEGGTHLRNMILSLQSPRNEKAASLFEKMGLSAYDASGNMRSLGDIFGDINEQLSGASAADVNSVLSTIFKQTDLASARAMLAATVDSVESLGTVLDTALLESGTSMAALGLNLQEMAVNFDTAMTQEQFAAQMLDQFGMSSEQAGVLFNGLKSIVEGTGNRFEELSGYIKDSAGACEDMYAIQLDNLNGDIDILKSGLSDLGISIYKDLGNPLRETTQLATSMVGKLSQAYGAGGMEGMVGAVGDCMSEVISIASEYTPEVVSMGVNLLENFIEGITDNSGMIAGAASEVLSVFTEGLFTLVPQVILAGIDLITEFADSVTEQAPQLLDSGTVALENFVSGIIERLPTVISTALTLVQTLVNSLGSNAPMLINSAVQLIGNLVIGITSMLPQILQMGIQMILSLAQGLISNLPLILQTGVQIIVSLASSITQMLPMIIQGGIQLIISLIQGIISNLGDIVQAAVEIVITLASGMIQAIPTLALAIPQLIQAIIDMIFETDWLTVGIDIINGIIEGILSAGASLWEAIKSLFFGGGKMKIDLSEVGAETAESYKDGVKSAASASVADTLSFAAVNGIDYTGATTAGIQTGNAFSAGLANGISANAFDGATFNTDMLNLGANGANAFTTGFDTALTGNTIGTGALALDFSGLTENVAMAGNNMNLVLDGDWEKANTNAQTAMQRLTSTVTDEANTAAEAIKDAFETMEITIPKPKIPVINVSTNSIPYGEGGNVSIPQFSVNWNALGGIFNKPTLFHTSAGMQGVGEAGPEAILPLDTLWAKMKEILNGAIAGKSGISIIDSFLEKLKSIGNRGKEPELAEADGVSIVWSPTYNLYGSAGKEEIEKADRMSQVEFKRRMQQHEKDRRRERL